MQRTSWILAVIGLLAFLVSGPTWAVSIDTVGGYDSCIDQDDSDTNDCTGTDIAPPDANSELAALCAMIPGGCAEGATLSTSDSEDDAWEAIEGGLGYAVDFCDANGCQTPTIFLIKLGGNANNNNTSMSPEETTYFFTNNDELTWAAIEQAFFNGITLNSNGNPINGGRISHVSWITTASVPEPGTLALLGLGLAGIGLARRRKTA